MSNTFVRRLITEQRNRSFAAILNYAEKHVYRHLTDRERAAFREKVAAAVGAYHDVVLDCLKASVDDDGVILNEVAMEMLQELHSAVLKDGVSRGR